MNDEYTGYCVRCKIKTPISEAKEVTMRNGRPAVTGKCPKCNCGMYRILSAKVK